MNNISYITAAISLSLVSSCTVLGPEFKTPEAKLPEKWTIESEKHIQAQKDNHKNWWYDFNDPALNELILEARNNNPGLQIAGLRVFAARAALGRSKTLLYPQSQSLGANVSQVGISRNGDLLQSLPKSVADETDDNFQNVGISYDAFWEFDFWGKFKRAIEASDAKLISEHYNYDDLMVTLLGEVSSTYIRLRTAEDMLLNNSKNIDIQKRGLDIVEVRFKEGLATELDIVQAKALLYNTQAKTPSLKNQITALKNILCQLLGRSPGQVDPILAKSSGIPTMPQVLSTDIPSELIRRRPDVRKAEKLAAAQCALIGMAEADLYPAFQLSGSIALLSDSGSDLFESDSIAGLGGFGLSWKILNYKRIKNNIRSQDAHFQQALTAYEMSVLNAAREVDSALHGFVNIHKETTMLLQGAQASERAVELAMSLYKDGLADYRTVLDTQRVQLRQQDAVVASKGLTGLNFIAAYKAMGGGWQLRETASLVPEKVKNQMQERTDWDDLLEDEPKDQ